MNSLVLFMSALALSTVLPAQSPSYTIFGSGCTGNCATFSMAIPPMPISQGLHFLQQALAVDPSAGNGVGAVVSDAAEAIVGGAERAQPFDQFKRFQHHRRAAISPTLPQLVDPMSVRQEPQPFLRKRRPRISSSTID